MLDLVRQLAALRASRLDVVLVSSGAQQTDRERLGFPRSQDHSLQTDAGRVGQGRIMHLWEQYFEL